jgi:hypothetical protein
MKQPLFPKRDLEPKKEVQEASPPSFFQYKDGEVALGYNTRGQKVTWEGKHENPLTPSNVVLITLESRRNVVIRGGRAVELPPFSSVGRSFGTGNEELQPFDINPEEIPELTIGEPCPELFGDNEKVKKVLFQYKIYDERLEGAWRETVSPFAVIRENSDKLGL